MKKTILIVEDNERNRKLVHTVLEFRGYGVAECVDGESALALALDVRPALILMDIRLPGIDGIEALRRLRNHPQTANTPIVAVTASVTAGDHERVIAAGFDDYVAKPIDIEAFCNTVLKLAGPAESATS